LDRAGTYLIRIGVIRHYDPNFFLFPDQNRGVSPGIGYQLNVSVQRHAVNPNAVELVGKNIAIVDGSGAGNSGRIVAYDAKSKTYTVLAFNGSTYPVNTNVTTWTVDASSKFEINYRISDEFSNYQPQSDSYSMVLTGQPTAPVYIDVLPQITR